MSIKKQITETPSEPNLFLFASNHRNDLARQVEELLLASSGLTKKELSHIATQCAQKIDEKAQLRAACIVTSPKFLRKKLLTLQQWLTEGFSTKLNTKAGLFLGTKTATPKIGFLFPGQGSPLHLTGGLFKKNFCFVQELYDQVKLPTDLEEPSTIIAQPAIVLASLAGLRVLHHFGIKADVAVGHSLGELTALHWGGVFDEESLLRIATIRGKAMQELASSTGTMAMIATDTDTVSDLIQNSNVTIACMNSPKQTVIAGDSTEVMSVVEKAEAGEIRALKIAVSHAFHSPLVAAAAPVFAKHLASETFPAVQQPVISTVTGTHLGTEDDLRALLYKQITKPVRFIEATREAAKQTDLFIEVGPGKVLSGLTRHFLEVPAIALDAGGPSLKGLLHVIGATFALGQPVKYKTLFA